MPRRLTQLSFLLLTLAGVFIYRGNAEQWCPFGGVEALYNYVSAGDMLCSLGVSNFYILGGILLMTLLLRRAFCGYVCPIGALSEWLGVLAARCGLRPTRVPSRLDRSLAKLKYMALIVLVAITWRAAELQFRAFDPCYALIGRHGEDITFWAYVVVGAIVLGSLLVSMPFCRWLCPLAAVLAPFSRFGFMRIKRDAATCTGCGHCTRACPMAIPVHQLTEVTAARCLACMECVTVCATQRTGTIGWGPPRRFGRYWPRNAAIGALLGCVGVAVAAVYVFPLPSFIRERGQPPAQPATAQLRVHGLTCRGKATALTGLYLWRDDLYAVPGYLKVEAWPGPGWAELRVTYDPTQATELAIKQAITEAVFDGDQVWASPFEVQGYDPLADLPTEEPGGVAFGLNRCAIATQSQSQSQLGPA